MIWWPPFIYCKVNKPRAKYLVIVDFWDALLISRAQSTRMVFDKKSNLDQLNLTWSAKSQWMGGRRGISESIHIFGVKYPGCQIIWQVTRASVFTARPSADSKPLRAFGPPAPPPFANCGIQQPSTCRGKKMLRHSKKLLYCSQVVIHPSMSVCGPILVDTMFRN